VLLVGDYQNAQSVGETSAIATATAQVGKAVRLTGFEEISPHPCRPPLAEAKRVNRSDTGTL
jgi:hypothetical protein